jgi:hypothetical protein
MPPQNFPERLKGGVLKIAIGAGYDLMMNDALESGDVAIHLNGKMNDPATRGQHMVRDLANAGYAAVNLGVKPVVFPLITPRRQKGYAGNVIRRFEDLRGSGDVKAMSEIHRIFRRYLEEKGIPFSSVSGAHGGADGEAIANLWDLVADLAETGNELVRWAKYVDMVEDAQGKPCFVTYSQPHLVVPQRVFDSDKPFFDELFALTQEAVDFLKVKEPALFDEKYLGLPGRFRERERALMEEGIIDREGHLLEAMA